MVKRRLARLLEIIKLKGALVLVYDLLRHANSLAKGIRIYNKTGSTPEHAYQSLIFLFCRTRGYSSDFLHFCLRLVFRPYKLENAHGVLGELNARDAAKIASHIKREGYYIFPSRLSGAACDSLMNFALTTPCQTTPPGAGADSAYKRDQPKAELYKFSEQSLIDEPEVQTLMADLSVLAVAQSYLGLAPILNIVTMWWSTTFLKKASSEAAQMYHFDMDRIKWLNFFFYLTDVTPETGPHCFIAKSHRAKGQPGELLRRGYVRISDEDIARFYPPEAFIEMTGPRGTMMAVDTRGFHKGKPPLTGDRLIFELSFSDSSFGAAYGQSADLKLNHSPMLWDRVRRYPRVFSKFSKAETPAPEMAESVFHEKMELS